MTIRLDLHHQPGASGPRPDCYICAECEQHFSSARWLVDHVRAGCHCAKHAAPPIGSLAREATAAPYIGRHRAIELAAQIDRLFDLGGDCDPPEYQTDEDAL